MLFAEIMNIARKQSNVNNVNKMLTKNIATTLGLTPVTKTHDDGGRGPHRPSLYLIPDGLCLSSIPVFHYASSFQTDDKPVASSICHDNFITC